MNEKKAGIRPACDAALNSAFTAVTCSDANHIIYWNGWQWLALGLVVLLLLIGGVAGLRLLLS